MTLTVASRISVVATALAALAMSGPVPLAHILGVTWA